jgi:hypothetical protein
VAEPSRSDLFTPPKPRISAPHRLYNPADLPTGTSREFVSISASDAGGSFGLLHVPPGGASACAFIMHPRTNQTDHYLAPSLLHAGIAVWGQTSRHINNDSDMTHEEVLLDTAAGMRMLRDRGFKRIIFLGTSGGGSLLGFYQAQASRPPGQRFEFTPAGEPTGFQTEDMPPGDLYIAAAAHQGEGRILLGLLDPAVVDENDPLATDPALDMFDARNGYRPHPEPSRYEPGWLVAYRAAQVERCRRLDRIAHSRLDAGRAAGVAADPSQLESPMARLALLSRHMVIFRTSANPAYADRSIYPNRRPPGDHPMRANYSANGYARVITPRAWLSSWSGLSSQAELTESIQEVTIPTLLVYADADGLIFPHEQEELLALAGARDKSLGVVEYAMHHMQPVAGMPANMRPPRERGGELIVSWLRRRLD